MIHNSPNARCAEEADAGELCAQLSLLLLPALPSLRGTLFGIESMDHVKSPSGMTSGATSPVDSFRSLQGTKPSAKKYRRAFSANGR